MDSGKDQMVPYPRPGGLVPLKLEEVKKYLEKEKLFMVDPKFLQENKDQLQQEHRLRRIKWIDEVALTKVGLSNVTAYLAKQYFDRVIACGADPVDSYDLLSVSCLFIAVKFEETIALEAEQFRHVDGRDKFSRKEIFKGERQVLDRIQWNGRLITPFDFVSFFMKESGALGGNEQKMVFEKSAKIIQRITENISYLQFRPSEIAASAVMMAHQVQDVVLPKALERDMDEASILKCCTVMRDMLQGESPEKEQQPTKRLRQI